MNSIDKKKLQEVLNNKLSNKDIDELSNEILRKINELKKREKNKKRKEQLDLLEKKYDLKILTKEQINKIPNWIQKDLKNCLLKMDIEGGALTIIKDLLYKKELYEIDLPIQIAAEIEVPKKIDNSFYETIKDISNLFTSLKKYYYLYYIARMKRFTNIDILLVRK